MAKGDGLVAETKVLRSPSDLLAGLSNISAQLVLTAAGYVTTVLLARALGPAAFGVFGLIYSLLLSVELIARFGIPTATTRLLAGAADPVAVCRSASGLTLLTSLSVFALVWITAPAVAELLDLPDGDDLLRLAAIDIPFFAVHLLLLAVVAGRGRFLFGALLTCIYAFARLCGVLAVTLLWPTVEGALLANVAASVVSMLVGIAGVGIRPLVPRLRDCTRLLSSASLVWIGNSLASIVPHIGLWSIPLLATGRDEVTVGMYAAALALARVPNMIPLGLAPMVLQRLAAASARGDLREVDRQLDASTRLALVMLVPGCAVLMLEADAITALLFGPAYAGAAGVVSILALGVGLGYSLLMLLRTALLAVGATVAATVITCATFIALVLVTAVLVSLAGAPGAAIATALVLPAAALATARSLARRVGDPLRGVQIVPLALPAVLLAGLSWMVPGDGLALFAELVLLGIVWLTAVWRLRLLPALAAVPVRELADMIRRCRPQL